MNRKLCEEIRHKVRNWIAPGIVEHPGVVELSRIWRIWGEEATLREVEKCLDGLGVIKLDVKGDKYYIFPDIVREAYDKIEGEIQELKDELRGLELKRVHLEAELRIAGELHDFWNDDWDKAELGGLEGKVSADRILAFVSMKFEDMERRLQSYIRGLESEIKDKRMRINRLKSMLDNLSPYYSIVEGGRVHL